jgi:DNA-binding MarR family transcriptional regulator
MDRSRLSTALEVISSVCDSGIPLHQVALLLFVGDHGSGGCTYAAIEARLGISNAAASRSVNSLSTSARHRKTEAMGLVEKIIDPEEGRRYKVRLTKKGLTLMRALDQL